MTAPAKLQQIVDLFGSAPREVKLQALLDYSRRIPPLPPELQERQDLFERVEECQSPFFLKVDVDDAGDVEMYFDAPAEAPTTRGYAGILSEGLADANATEILSLSDDFYLGLGLGDVISPLRLRGMAAIVFRLKRQIRQQLETVG